MLTAHWAKGRLCNVYGGITLPTSPAGTSSRAQAMNAMEDRQRQPVSCCCASDWIEEFTRFEHGMHDDSQLARHGNGGALEADPLPKL